MATPEAHEEEAAPGPAEESAALEATATKITAPPPPKKKWGARRLLGIGARVALGTMVGLGLAEVIFSMRDHGSFPHLNVYQADSRLGLRLRPGATERIALGKNPLTHVRINAQGFRGADLPPPVGGEVIVVGDSQVFGLGVEEDQTASADLATALGKPVINAGIPTYGPLEYNTVTKELLARYQPSVVVYVVNFANDLFEASHPNATRHAEWDGWAVRKETAPASIRSFPGRELLYRDSHAFFALRGFLYKQTEKLDDRGFASEGSVDDLVGVSRSAHDQADSETKAIAEQRQKDILSTDAQEVASESKLEDAALDAFDLRGYEYGIAYQKSRDNPGDIVVTVEVYQEEARAPSTTAQVIFNGTKVRKEMEARIRTVVEKKVAFEKAKAEKLTMTYDEREALKKKLADLRAAPLEIVRAWSPMTPLLRDVKAICDARGARLLVVALPMDIQVSETEWAKYGAGQKPVDMDSTKILFDDLIASSEALGALGLDATDALRAAEPGAFLDGDLHMTPKGHRALADAIARKLAEPPRADTPAHLDGSQAAP